MEKSYSNRDKKQKAKLAKLRTALIEGERSGTPALFDLGKFLKRMQQIHSVNKKDIS